MSCASGLAMQSWHCSAGILLWQLSIDHDRDGPISDEAQFVYALVFKVVRYYKSANMKGGTYGRTYERFFQEKIV